MARATRKSPAPRRPSDAEIHATIERTRIKAVAWSVPLSIAALGLLALACTPLAHAIAGKKTDLEVNITLSLSIVFSITTALATGTAAIYRKANQRLRKDNAELRKKVKETQDQRDGLERELTDARGRMQDLEDAAGA